MSEREAAINKRRQSGYYAEGGDVAWLLAELAAAREAHLDTMKHADNLYADLEAAREREEKLREAMQPIIREYDLWSEDANDGEFRLWDLDRLCMAIVNARAALSEGEAT